MKLLKYWCGILLILMLTGCGNTSLTLQELETKFGNSFEYIFNTDGMYVLSVKKNFDKNIHQPPLSFFIYDAADDSVIYRENLPGGNVKWVNENQVEVNIIPGNITGDETPEDLNYIFDVKKKVRLNN